MKKLTKKIILLLMVSFLAFPIFAERKTRVDKAGNCSVKIIWNSNNRGGPDDTNWAEVLTNLDWKEVKRYHFLLDPKAMFSRTCITMYIGKNEILVTEDAEVDGLWEKASEIRFFSWDYNSANDQFIHIASYYEGIIASYDYIK